MKTRRIILSSLLVLILCLAVPLTGLATEQSTSIPDSKAKTGTESPPSVTKMVNKAEKAETALLDIGKAYSFPLIFYSFIAGAVLLVVGVISGWPTAGWGIALRVPE